MILTIDFETYYDKKFSLSKLTTEEYVRDERFQTIGVGVKRDDEPAVWFSGSDDEIREFLSTFDWEKSLCLAHNAMFDLWEGLTGKKLGEGSRNGKSIVAAFCRPFVRSYNWVCRLAGKKNV